MNKVVNFIRGNIIRKGSLLIDNNVEEYYILSTIPTDKEKYIAVSLLTGKCWDYPTENISSATEGLEFICNDCKITIENL